MKETLNLWLSRHARLPGVLACLLRYPDGTVFAQAWAEGFAGGSFEHVARGLADTFQVLQFNRLPAVHLRWVYQRALLYCARRPDGTCLAVFTTREGDQTDPLALQELFRGFQSADLAPSAA